MSNKGIIAAILAALFGLALIIAAMCAGCEARPAGYEPADMPEATTNLPRIGDADYVIIEVEGGE